MNDDLISRQAAIDMFQNLADDDWNKDTSTTWANAFAESADMIEDLPAAQPQRMRERWIDMAGDGRLFRCSGCDEIVCCAQNNYCPNCGARMDGGEQG